ncbi:MAG TPA: hypothetical protein EYG90_03000 [Campylobacterales bacterium]|nr:hypothetical protein [Campylobacterales bacterium]
MRKTILLLTTLLFGTACTNGTPNIENSRVVAEKNSEMMGLKSALTNYTDATINNDIDTLITFVYPKVFTLLSKEKMIAMLKQMYASDKAPKITAIEHTNFSPIESYKGGSFSIVTSFMSMELSSPAVDNPKLEDMMCEMLERQMGKDAEVRLDKDKHVFFVKKKSKVIGIKEGKEGWKFIGYAQAKKYTARDIIPKAVSKKINSL